MSLFGDIGDSIGKILPSSDKVSGFLKGVAPFAGAAAGAKLGEKLGLGAVAGGLAGFAATNAVLSPTATRMAGAGIFGGGANSPVAGKTPAVSFGGPQGIAAGAGGGDNDWRVRITLPPASPIFAEAFQTVMLELASTKGVVFPYTPQVSFSHSAKYDSQSLAHTNYTFYTYTGSETGAITVNGDFSVQSAADARYLIGAIYFFRACTKMFYATGEFVGNPPPIVYLSGYGKYLLPQTPCIITSFTHNMPNDVDYMAEAAWDTTSTEANWVPTYTTLSVTLQPVVSRIKQSSFNLNDFAAGRLIQTPSGGGFL